MIGSRGWPTDLSYGQKREADFLALFPFLTRRDGYKEDFVTPNGHKLELKSERRSSLETPNVAIEVCSSWRKPGALHNAKKNGVKYVTYFFANNYVVVYRLDMLYAYVRRHLASLRIVEVPGSSATVVLIPRWKLKFCETSIE